MVKEYVALIAEIPTIKSFTNNIKTGREDYRWAKEIPVKVALKMI